MVLRWNYAYGDTFLAQLPALGTVTLLVEGRRTTYTPEFLVKNVNECEDTAPNAHHEPPIGQSVCGVNGQCVDTLGAFTCRCRDGITSQSNCKSLHDAAVQLPYGALERKELYVRTIDDDDDDDEAQYRYVVSFLPLCSAAWELCAVISLL